MPLPASHYNCQRVMMAAMQLTQTNLTMMVFPGVTPLDGIVQAIEGTRRSLTLVCHDLTCPKIAFAVMRLHARPDVSVRVLTDERSATKLRSLVARLQAKNVSVTLTDGVEYTFCLIDDDVLLAGSMDWTSKTEQQRQQENYVVCVSGLVGQLPTEFARVLNAHWPNTSAHVPHVQTPSPPPATAASPAPPIKKEPTATKKAKTATGATTTAAKAPASASQANEASVETLGESLGYIIAMIDNAKKSVRFLCRELNTKSIADALIRAHKRPGVTVQGVVCAKYANSQASQVRRMQAAGLMMLCSDDDLETRMIMDDELALGGTTDWTARTEEQWRAIDMVINGDGDAP